MSYLLYFSEDKEYFYSANSDTKIQPISDFSKADELPKHSMLIDVISNAKEIITCLNRLIDIIRKDNYTSEAKEVKTIYKQLSKYSILFNNFENDILKRNEVGKNGIAYIMLIKDTLPFLIDKVNLYSNIDVDIEEQYKGLSNEIKLAIKILKHKGSYELTTNLPKSADTYLIQTKEKGTITYEEYLTTLLKDTFQKVEQDSYYKFKKNEPFENAFHNNDYQYVESLPLSVNSKEFKEMEKAISKQHFINATYYQCEKIFDIYDVLFYQYKISKDVISKCANCGKYFKVENGHEKYCDRPISENSDKTCKDVGKNKTYRENVKSRPAKMIHEKNSQYYRVNKKRAIDKGNKKEAELFTRLKEAYETEYSIKLKAFNENTLSEKQFIEWLNTKGVNDNGNKRNNKE